MPELKVLKCGAYGSIQDIGRTGLRHIGIPVSGVLDEQSANSANLLCGNQQNHAVLELFGPGWEFEFSHATMIAISGADCNPTIDNRKIYSHTKQLVHAGSVLSLMKKSEERITYISILGGFQTLEILGSRSLHPQFTKPYMLTRNMLIPYGEFKASLDSSGINIQNYKTLEESKVIKVYPGPEWAALNIEEGIQLSEREWTISKGSNRMAYLLEEHLPVNSHSILTSAVWPGIVQLTPSGKMIVLMKDAQTTGGYPRILTIEQNELNKLAQMNPGIKFKWKMMF